MHGYGWCWTCVYQVGPLKTEVNNGSLQYSEGERANEQYEKVHDVKDAILLSIPKLAIQKTRFYLVSAAYIAVVIMLHSRSLNL